jgi:hypothetical protein
VVEATRKLPQPGALLPADYLLSAIRDVFEEVGTECVLTVDLLRRLVEREAEPWPAWWGKEVDAADDTHPPGRLAGTSPLISTQPAFLMAARPH